jgi:pyruvate/2-oxoglutarate/acetoin dehydrogenase E1 component
LYRSAAEVELWRRDPIGILKQYLIENRMLDDTIEGAHRRRDDRRGERCGRGSRKAPDPDDPFAFVYANPIIPLDRPDSRPPGGRGKNLVTAINATLHEILAAEPRASVFGQDVADPKGACSRRPSVSREVRRRSQLQHALAESLIIGVAVGVAAAGGRPIPEIQFADYIHPGFDQIVSEVARLHYRTNGGWSCPMVIRVPYGGGIHGALYHSQSIEAFYAHVPGLKVVVPSTPADAKGLLWAAFEDPDPVMFLEPKKLYRLVRGRCHGPTSVPLGKAALRRRTTSRSSPTDHGPLRRRSGRSTRHRGIEAEVLDPLPQAVGLA